MSDIVHVMIADDHRIVIDGLKSLLTNSRYQVSGEAQNGQEAFNMIRDNPTNTDILITDISMPLLNGIELCQSVKLSFPDIKVLILSMYNSISMVKEAMAAEADGYLLKNSGRDELLTALYKISNNCTYYSAEILPIIYGQIKRDDDSRKNTQMLTSREKEILTLIVKEYTSEEIAGKLCISKKTVDNHRANILEKTKCRSTIALVKFALKNGIN